MTQDTLVIVAAVVIVAASPATAEEAGGVTIAREDCARLVAHSPAPDVAYQPGVDVRGQEVAPADLNAAPVRLKETLVIDLTVDLAERLGIPADPDNFQADLELGTVELRGTRVYFDGQPLQDEAQAELAERCRVFLSQP